MRPPPPSARGFRILRQRHGWRRYVDNLTAIDRMGNDHPSKAGPFSPSLGEVRATVTIYQSSSALGAHGIITTSPVPEPTMIGWPRRQDGAGSGPLIADPNEAAGAREASRRLASRGCHGRCSAGPPIIRDPGGDAAVSGPCPHGPARPPQPKVPPMSSPATTTAPTALSWGPVTRARSTTHPEGTTPTVVRERPASRPWASWRS